MLDSADSLLNCVVWLVACRLNELADVLIRGRAGKQRLRKKLRNLAVCHERMHQNLVQSRSRSWISGQNAGNQISGFIRNWNVLWERVLVAFDSAVCGLDIGCLKGRFSDYQRVDDDSEGPNVDLIRMTSSSFQNLRSDVVGCSANGPLFLSVKIELCGKSEVSQFDLHFFIYEEVAQLQVSVNNAMRMQVFQRIDDLQGVALDLELVQALASLEQLVETVVGAQFKQDVNIVDVFEEVNKLCHIRMFD